MINIFATLILISISTLGYSQEYKYKKHVQAVTTVVDGINQQNYQLMQKPWGLLGKVLISNKMLRNDFQPFSIKNGLVEIDTIIFNSVYHATAQLKFKQASDERIFLTFYFNEKGKVNGLGFGYPIFIYKNKNIPSSQFLTIDQKRNQIDSIVLKYANGKAPDAFNGCIMVTEGDEILYKSSQGFSDFENKTTLNDSSVFLLASCTKQFTAVAILQLKEKGKLKLDDKVQSYLPQFPYQEITIEHLLTHTAGLPDYFQLLEKYWDKTKFATNADVLDLLDEHKPKLFFDVNEQFSYSNTGYVILSLLIEKISGQTYAEHLKQNIFDPLKMQNTYVYHRRAQEDTLQNYAKGYEYSMEHNKYMLPDSLKTYQYTTYMDKITGDDGVSSSIYDLKIWNEALQKHLLINERSTELAYTNHKLNNGTETGYGYGFMLRKGDGIEDVIYHTGGWPGYSTMILRFVDRDKSIVVLSNNGYEHFDFLVDEICKILLK
jgi:CubicO group peptidase (beta-lactamase class C family)